MRPHIQEVGAETRRLRLPGENPVDGKSKRQDGHKRLRRHLTVFKEASDALRQIPAHKRSDILIPLIFTAMPGVSAADEVLVKWYLGPWVRIHLMHCWQRT